MAHDTSKDPRILVAHRACVLLSQSLQQKLHVKLSGKEKLTATAASMDSAVMTLMYSYQPPRELVSSPATEQIVAEARELNGALEPLFASSAPSPLLQANLRWCLRVLAGLPGRLANSGTTLASGVDLVAVKVSNVARTGSLWMTRIFEGALEYPVVTNIAGMRAGQVRAAAFLPPREVGGAVSEAMYLGDDPRTEPVGTLLDEAQVDAREAASILHEELGKH